MGASGVNLDSAPPPSVSPSPTLGGLAGQGQQQSSPAGGSAQIVMEHMMEVEKLLGKIADIRPDSAPIIDNLVQSMRARLGKALMSDAPQQNSGAPSIAGLMASPAPTTPMS